MTVTGSHIRSLRADWADEGVAVTHLDPGYPSSNSVWLVRGRDEAAIVRVCTRADVPENSFWHGMGLLFGTNPRRELASYAELTDRLRRLGDVQVPGVAEVVTDVSSLTHPFVIVEHLSGQPVSHGRRRLDHAGPVSLPVPG